MPGMLVNVGNGHHSVTPEAFAAIIQL